MGSNNKKKVVIYGGNGFVGTHTAESIINQGGDVVCVSRTGHKPIHLKGDEWSNNTRWCKGDANQPCQELLSTADSLVCLIGSPPIPTLSKDAFEQQLLLNGTACVSVIEAAQQVGIKRLVLLSARVPFPLRTERFAYFKGKEMAKSAAEKFAQTSGEHSAVVLLPGMITGKRALKNGKFVRLDIFTAPIAPLMPWQFVSVERVARRVADAALSEEPYTAKYTEIANRDI